FDRQLNLAGVMPLLGYRSALKSGREMPSNIFFNLATWHTINSAYTRQTMAEQKELALEAAEPEKTARLITLLDKRAGHWLANEVEHAKIALSDQHDARLHLDTLEAGLVQTLSREEFEAAGTPLMERVAGTVAALLRDAGLAVGDVDT